MTGSGKFTQVALFVVTRKTVPTRNVEFCFKIVQDDSHFENVGRGDEATRAREAVGSERSTC